MLFSHRARIACLIVAGCAGVFICFRRPEPPARQADLDTAAMRELAKLGDGLLVWERRVKGTWQIWMKSLDGRGGEERLVPEEEGRDHFCPKFSPDGRRLAYMSYARGESPYDPALGVLWMLDVTTRKRTMLADKARSYYEDRAVVWFDDNRLCHVDEHGNAVELDTATRSGKKLTNAPHKKHGWLVNAQKTHATSGDPEFALLEAGGRVQAQPKHGGCQPYFSSDGRWGFWMGGSGGPVNKMFLPTRAVGQILDLNDRSMPADRNYLYFPMVSRCQRLMAFGASSDDHDHFDSDYDVFVVRMDAQTLDPIGEPVRFTAFQGNDRFPDVFCRELPLGSHFVEGPTRLVLRPPGGKFCQWQVDGAEAGAGATFSHRFANEGDHWVSAKQEDGTEHRGLVHVRAARTPALTLVRRAEGNALSLTFDEAVALGSATAEMMNGVKLAWGPQTAERHRVLLPLPDDTKPGARITLTGVRDLAQHPNVMSPTSIRVPGALWPQSRDGLLLAWESRHTTPTGIENATPTRSGKAFWNPRGGMDMRGGSFELPDAGTAMLRECGRSGAFTLEAIITPMVPPYDKAMRPVLSLEDDAGNVKLALLQLRSAWSLWLATEDNPRGTTIEQPLTPIKTGQPHHIVLGYESGRFQLHVNGAQLWVRSQLKGALKWEATPGRLRIGACSKFDGNWQGMVDQFALHSRMLSASEAIAHADYAAPKVDAQRAVKTKKAVVRLVQASRQPTLAEITPYREALVQHLYEVLPKDEGDDEQSFPVGSSVAVSHWVWVNGEAAAAPPAKVGETFRLFVEPKEAHAEIKSLVVRSDLSPEVEAVELLDVSNW